MEKTAISDNIWMPIKGYDGYYVINIKGEIKSLERKIPIGKKYRTIKEKYISQRIDRGGYLTVRLSKDGITQTCFVHRLIGIAFVPNPCELKYINHKDGNKLNNENSNLEWCSHQENVIHAYTMKLHKVPSNRCKKVIDVTNNRVYNCISNAAKELQIPYSTVKNYLNGNRNNPTSLRYLETNAA